MEFPLTDSGPASDIKLAIHDPMLPQLAKKMRRFIGLSKYEENMNVMRINRIPAREIQELTLSVVTIAESWLSVNLASVILFKCRIVHWLCWPCL